MSEENDNTVPASQPPVEKKTRKVAPLVAMGHVALMDGPDDEAKPTLEIIVGPDENITTMADMRKRLKDAGYVNRQFPIYRDTGEVVEYEKVEVIKEKS